MPKINSRSAGYACKIVVVSDRPHSTNGRRWPQPHKVTWTFKAHRKTAWPNLCYAYWSKPDAEYQKARFGRVVLDGKPLADYMQWYSELTEPQRVEWDAFISGLTPDEDIIATLKSFRFSSNKRLPVLGSSLILWTLSPADP